MLLLVGGFLAASAGSPASSSSGSPTADKLLGTLVVPGGPAVAPMLLIFVSIGSSGPGAGAPILFAVAFVALVAAPITTAVHLARRSR